MKTKLFALRFAALATAIAFSAGAMAETTTPEQPAAPHHAGKKKQAAAIAAAAASESAQGPKLDEAYGILATCDHDYKGHRKSAMHKIEEAAKILGQTLHGDGKGHEKQMTSDEGVRQAQSILENAVGGLAGKARRHVEAAIKQLSVALTVK